MLKLFMGIITVVFLSLPLQLTTTMKRILFVLLMLGAAMSSKAQHTLQIDDAAGRYGIIQSNPLWPFGVTMFELPPTGGTLVVAPPPGVPALMWLTDAAGNTLTGGSAS